MLGVTEPGRARRVRASLLLFTGVLLPLVAQPACGSEDSKKRVNSQYDPGGGAGEHAGGSSNPSAGVPSGTDGGLGATGPTVDGGSAGTDGGGTAGAATAGAGTDGGSSNAGQPGSGGQSGSDTGPDCPSGTADCDDNPTTCEANVTTLAQCGACGVACQQTNGTVICGGTGCEVTSCQPNFADCQNAGVDGCETSLTASPNCGMCGRDCAGAKCTTNLCEPTQLGGVANAATRWAMTSDALYRINGYTPGYGLPTNYTLTRTPLSGGADVVMHSDSKSPGGLAFDATDVYWAVDGTPPAVLKKAHAAAAVTVPTPVFEPASIPVQMKIQGGKLYWTNLAGAIFSRSLGAPINDSGTQLVSAAEVAGTGTFNLHQDFAVTATAMYWVVLNGQSALIRTAPLTGGAASDVPGAVTNSFYKLSLQGEDLYWVRATGAALDGAYHYKPGGNVEPLVLQAGLGAVLADSQYLYLLGTNSAMYRAPLGGGASVKLGDGSGVLYALDFAGQDASRVYVLTPFTKGAGFWGDYKPVYFPK